MVGCVIVYKNKIIGEGYTGPYGGSHAEVNAINAVKDKSLLSQATLYVTLEPCSHHGKTPPCTNLILEYNIPKVVIGLKDPHDKVAGKGIKKLEASGCKVTTGILKEECRKHHKRFLTFHGQKRPYIILKWAETLDGFIAPDDSIRKSTPEPFWITNRYSKQLVHQWRTEEQAILVGTKTVLADNPELSVRNWKGNHPIRVIIDQNLTIPSNYHVLDKTVKTILLTQIEDQTNYKEGIDYEVIDFFIPLGPQICSVLHKHNITSVIVEGGTKTLQTFIDEDLWDEARIFKGTSTFGHGTAAPRISGKLIESTPILSDNLSLLKHD